MDDSIRTIEFFLVFSSTFFLLNLPIVHGNVGVVSWNPKSEAKPIIGDQGPHRDGSLSAGASLTSESEINPNSINNYNVSEGTLKFIQEEFGSKSRFAIPSGIAARWVAYFFEESLATVLQTPENIMIDCTIIEVRNGGEQRMSKKMIGTFMEIVPLELRDMIHLMRLCGELPKNNLPFNPHITSRRKNGLESRSSSPQHFSPIILPGTLWCGIRDSADRYENIGEKVKLDKCCRAHDYCPLKVAAFQTRYGVTNLGLSTRSHCLCEDEFYECLKKASNKVADGIGNFYFNVLKVKCLDGPIIPNATHSSLDRRGDRSPGVTRDMYECMKRDAKGKCRYWKRKNMNLRLSMRHYSKRY